MTNIWESELKSLVKNVPDIQQYLKEVENHSWVR
jgi:hypothetical protein